MQRESGPPRQQDDPNWQRTLLELPLTQSAVFARLHSQPLFLQRVLADQAWGDRLAEPDRRALTPLFWNHVNPYGRFEFDMDRQLDLELPAAA